MQARALIPIILIACIAGLMDLFVADLKIIVTVFYCADSAVDIHDYPEREAIYTSLN